jgi:hypothetical protein
MRASAHTFRLAAFVALLAAVMLTGLAAPQFAAAGEYTIHTCEADEAGYSSAAFEVFAERGMKWRRACDPRGPGLRGLVSSNVPGPGRVPRGAEAGFILNAPPGTTFSRMRWSGHAHRRDCRYALQLYAERPGTTPVAIKNVRANKRCPRTGMAQSSNYPLPRAYDLDAASRIIQRTVCVGSPSREYCSARGQNYIGTVSVEATVVDGIAPTVGVVQDSALARGEWVRGRQSFTFDAVDNVGVKSASAIVAGGQRGASSRSCNYTQRIPCPSGPGLIDVNTAEIPEGSQALTVAAEDAAGNRAESGAIPVRIDNAAPGSVAIGVGGGEGWRNSNDFDLAWANPPEPDRAPIVAAHYRLCRVGGDCLSGDRDGAGIAAIDNIAVPSPGEWELRLWREDAAGNEQSGNASQPVRLRFDPEPPQLGFEGQNAEDPTRVAVLVTDRISGLGGGQIEISPAGSGTWQVLQTSQEGDHLVTRIDDASLPAGEYELRASARDQATNLGSTNQRLDGQPMRLTLPLRVATSMKAGVIGKRLVTRKGAKKKVRRTVLEPRAKVDFGRRVRVGGNLANASGHPLAGVKVRVYSQPPEGAEKLEDTITTDSAGRFVYEVEARSSRRFRFAYEGTATILPAGDEAELLVTATSTFAVRPGHVLNGESVWFSGRVRGRPLPEEGKLVELQWLDPNGDWQTFRTVKTKPDGTWRYQYPFDNTCGQVVFRFLAFLPGEAGFPLKPGYSHEVKVKVRGRPC